jgi:hypothetical protein
MAVTADSVYQLIKTFEGQFPILAPYFTLPVGTFDAASGGFASLSTTTETDPEPIEHGPHDHPRSRPLSSNGAGTYAKASSFLDSLTAPDRIGGGVARARRVE